MMCLFKIDTSSLTSLLSLHKMEILNHFCFILLNFLQDNNYDV